MRHCVSIFGGTFLAPTAPVPCGRDKFMIEIGQVVTPFISIHVPGVLPDDEFSSLLLSPLTLHYLFQSIMNWQTWSVIANFQLSVSDGLLGSLVKDLPFLVFSTSSLCALTLVFNFLLVSPTYLFSHPPMVYTPFTGFHIVTWTDYQSPQSGMWPHCCRNRPLPQYLRHFFPPRRLTQGLVSAEDVVMPRHCVSHFWRWCLLIGHWNIKGRKSLMFVKELYS